MQTTTYQALIESRVQYERMLNRLGLSNSQNRWTVAYELVQELEYARSEGSIDDLNPVLVGRMRFALTDLDNLVMIMNQFQDEDSQLFKKKIKEMLKGSVDQTRELSGNNGNLARNTQAELMLCARFKEVGLIAELHDPHPDIIVRVNGRKYGFECKRIYSTDSAAVRSNVRDAINQLLTYYIDDDYTKRGMPILCIDRHISGGDRVLQARSEQSSRDRLSYEIEQFVRTYRRHWSGFSRVRDERLIGVMIYINMTTLLETEGIQVVSQQSGACNSGWTRWGHQMYQEYIDDIAHLLGPTNITPID